MGARGGKKPFVYASDAEDVTDRAVEHMLDGVPLFPERPDKPPCPAPAFPSQEGVFDPQLWKQWLAGKHPTLGRGWKQLLLEENQEDPEAPLK